ncbi:DUF2304 domain-containing protein [Agaribacterium haliotis]|uniref:DUF2304 domain-containing protein n=1 Tax=Agaribacterium haliotis TaxID=2013869 RepID=UPI000BB57D68|nr:DUF2304 domain-containing protein [Agaribacterium haliotis]
MMNPNELFASLTTQRMQIFAIILSVLLFLFVVRLVKRKHIRVEYSLVWLGFTGLFVVLAVFRDLVDFAASLLGIAYAPTAILMLLIISIFCILIQFSIVISSLSEKCKLLTQELAILRREFEDKTSVAPKENPHGES